MSFDVMSRVEDLRAQAQQLYEQALKIKDGDERLVIILRAMELETEADVLERRRPPTPASERSVVQQQQQPQSKDEGGADEDS